MEGLNFDSESNLFDYKLEIFSNDEFVSAEGEVTKLEDKKITFKMSSPESKTPDEEFVVSLTAIPKKFNPDYNETLNEEKDVITL